MEKRSFVIIIIAETIAIFACIIGAYFLLHYTEQPNQEQENERFDFEIRIGGQHGEIEWQKARIDLRLNENGLFINNHPEEK